MKDNMGAVLPKYGTQPENGLPENVHGIIVVGANYYSPKTHSPNNNFYNNHLQTHYSPSNGLPENRGCAKRYFI
jgi:hypothetical protein